MKKLMTKGILLLFVIYLVTIIVLGDDVRYYWVSNLVFVVLVAFMIIYLLLQPRAIPFKVLMFVPFLLFCFLSYTWAYTKDSSFQRCVTLLRLAVLLIVMSAYLIVSGQTKQFISGIAVSGVFVVLYTVMYYGFSELTRLMSSGVRVGEDFVNSNTLAVFLSFSAVIMLYAFLEKKKIPYLLLFFGIVVIVAATGSKKGLLDLGLGLVMTLLFKLQLSDKARKTQIIISVLIVAAIFFGVMWDSPLFYTVKYRFSLMLGFVSGSSSAVDYSTLERQIMLKAGWNQFLKTPLFGIGIGSSGYVTSIALGINTYLHNEFIELLTCVGIVGFLLHFIPASALLFNNWRKRKRSANAQLCSIMMALYFLNSFAAVQIYSKFTYVIFAISIAAVCGESYSETPGNELLDCI